MERSAEEFMTKYSAFYIQQEAWDDIAEYEEDFNAVIKQRESTMMIPFRHQSPQLEYRQFLIEFLETLCIERKYSHSCLSLSVYMLDVFMDNHSISAERLLLVALCCFILAAKMEENKEKIPKYSEINENFGCLYSTADFINTEITIWNFFDGSLMFPTAAHNIYYYIQKIISKEDLTNGMDFRTLFYDLHGQIRIYLDKIIKDVHYMQCFSPSKIAAAVIAASRIDNKLSSWTVQLENMTKYKIEQLNEIITFLRKGDPLQCYTCGTLNE